MFPLSSFAVVEKTNCAALHWVAKTSFRKFIHLQFIIKGHILNREVSVSSVNNIPAESWHNTTVLVFVYRHTVNNSRTSTAHRFSTKLEFAWLLAAKEKGLVDHSVQCFKLTYMSLPAPPPFTTPPRCHMAEDLQKKKGGSIPVNPKFLEWSLVLQR